MTPTWVTAFFDLAPDVHADGAAFWRAVTGYDLSPTRGGRDEFATLVPADGDAYLKVQRVSTSSTAEGGSTNEGSRIHLDLHEDRDEDFDVHTSPAGLTYCRVGHRAAHVPTPASWPGGRSRVDQVCLDLPPSVFEQECAFWEQLTGWSPTRTGSPEFRRLDGAGMPLRMLLQRLDDEGPARIHLDLSADDREAEVARHLELGAIYVHPGRGWTTLRDPAGLEYCVTDRSPGG